MSCIDATLCDSNQIDRSFGLLKVVNKLFESSGLCRLLLVAGAA
jgi:hypothetical protein